MAHIEEAFSISDGLNFNLYENEMIRDDLFKTLIVTEDDLLLVRKQFNPDTYIEESNKFKNIVKSKVTALYTLKIDIDNEHQRFVALHESKKSIESKCSDLDVNDITESINKLIETQDQKLKELHEQYRQTKKELSILHKYSPHYVDNDPRHLCPVCMNAEVEAAIVPCGHTLCNMCCYKLDEQRCFICRNEVAHTLKLYFN